MKNILNYLYQRPLANVLIAIAYYLLVTLPHEEVGKWIAGLFEDVMRDDYNAVILYISLAGMVGYLFFLYANARNQSLFTKKLIAFYLLSSLVLAVVCFKLLMVVNVEFVHFVQYACMAVLLVPLVRRYGETLYWVTLLGALDEAFQYFYLAPQRTNYYDFNDIAINLIGGTFGLLLVRAVQPSFTLGRRGEWFRSPVFVTTAAIAVLTFISLKMKWLHMFPPADDPKTIWALVKVPADGFWTVVHPNVTFHVMTPVEGVIVVGLLLLFYAGIGNARAQ